MKSATGQSLHGTRKLHSVSILNCTLYRLLQVVELVELLNCTGSSTSTFWVDLHHVHLTRIQNLEGMPVHVVQFVSERAKSWSYTLPTWKNHTRHLRATMSGSFWRCIGSIYGTKMRCVLSNTRQSMCGRSHYNQMEIYLLIFKWHFRQSISPPI